MNFLGISNVTDCEPILGADGIADGFIVSYTKTRTVKAGKKTLTKQIPCKKTVYVRDFDPNSIRSDSTLHGFGRPTVYTKKVSKPKTKKTVKISASAFKSIMAK